MRIGPFCGKLTRETQELDLQYFGIVFHKHSAEVGPPPHPQ